MIRVQNVCKKYREGREEVSVLKNLSFQMGPQKKIGILGASGVGKSTLLHVLGGLDEPTSGAVLIENENLYQLPEEKRSKLRNRYFGFVFQFYHLLPELTALENVRLPALIAGLETTEGIAHAGEALKRVGLEGRLHHLPSELSGGEQQRVALARACVLKPKLILADEPTGNLDHKSGDEVLHYLFEVVKQTEGSLILVTHNRELIQTLDEVFELREGQLWKITN